MLRSVLSAIPMFGARIPSRSALRRGAHTGLIAAAFLLLTVTGCGGDDDDEPAENRPLTQPQRVKMAEPGTVSITGKSSETDENGVSQTFESGGTGVVVDSDQGLVLTNSHVVEGLKSIEAQVAGGESAASVHGQAPCQDLAVIELRTPPPAIKELKLGNSDTVRSGQHVTAVGYPGDIGEAESFAERAYSATEGTVSVAKTEVQGQGDIPHLRDVIRHQVPISGGNSGGPLLDDKAEVIGINTLSGESDEANVQSQNIAIGVNQVKAILPDLLEGNNIGYVGWDLSILPGTDDVVVVDGVDSGSPANRANFRPGDAIFEVEGQRVDSKGDVCEILDSKDPGDIISVSGLEPPYGEENFYSGVNVRVQGSVDDSQ